MSSREERIGLNEAVFRQVNERIEDMAETFQPSAGTLDLICECGDPECVQPITMTPAEYERLRSNAHHFAVYPGHEIEDVESIVERHERYEIVAKTRGVPEQIAEQTDSRS